MGEACGAMIRRLVALALALPSWAAAAEPVGERRSELMVLMVDTATWTEIARVPVHGQPVFAIAQPGGRRVWVNFAFPKNDVVQVIDVPSRKVVRELAPGKAVLHMEFTPRGEQVWISARDDDRVTVYDTASFAPLARIAALKPSGIFFTSRAAATGF